ncbi:UNVERIFIED_CONTAM: hypothetical protein FKN15_018765 [Acipenser sinensis]
MVWGCFAASGPGRLVIIEGTMNSALYQRILQENVSQHYTSAINTRQKDIYII